MNVDESFFVLVTFLSTQANLIQYYVRSNNKFSSLNPVTHLVLRMIIVPEHSLVHIPSEMTLDFSYFGKKMPF